MPGTHGGNVEEGGDFYGYLLAELCKFIGVHVPSANMADKNQGYDYYKAHDIYKDRRESDREKYRNRSSTWADIRRLTEIRPEMKRLYKLDLEHIYKDVLPRII